MKVYYRSAVVSILLYAWSHAFASPGSQSAPSEKEQLCRDGFYYVGVGHHDITGPAAELGMMGYADANQTTAGLHMRLRARAFALEDPCTGKEFALVVSDL